MKVQKYKTKYHTYILTFNYDQAIVSQLKQLQQEIGWQNIIFYKDEKILGWVFSDLSILDRFTGLFQIEMDANVVKDLKTSEKVAKLQEKGVSTDELREDLDIPTLQPLFSFQIQAVDFIGKVGGRALLAMEMGTGKTCTAIGYAAYKRYGRVLVVCPASVKENWKREIKKFAGVDARILTDEEPGGWEIINYDQLQKFAPYFKKQDYDLIICDESHYLKSKKAIRTKEAFKILKKAKDALFLTGTPILNRPIEVYTTFNYITPMSYWTFCQTYCGAKETRWGWDLNGASNLDDLKKKMFWMHRRTKEEVLTQLPDKTVNVLQVELKDWKEYKQVLEDFRQWLIDKDLSLGALYAEALTKANYLKQVAVKNKKLKEVIDDFLDNNRKMIVFSQYKEIINNLHKEYAECSVKLTGETPASDRQGIIDRYQNDPDVRIFFATIKAGGVGINLTEADTVLFTDLDWTPATHAQAEDRAYRIGQKNNVNVYYLLTPGTIDEKIWKMLRRKEKMVNQILAGEENVRKVHIKSLLKNL